jgi:hypothetical protein
MKMKRQILWMFAAILMLCGMMVSSCSKEDNPGKVEPQPQAAKQVGTYLWYGTVCAMGDGGAVRLADMYEKAGFKHVVLLVKGDDGEICYFKNNLSNAPLGNTPKSQNRDVLQEVINAMHAKNIKVYAWIMVGADRNYVAAHPDEAMVHFNKTYVNTDYVTFNDEAYSQYLANIVREIDQNYDVDGFAADGARYHGDYFGWGLTEFQKLTAPLADGGYGLTLDEYNELVTLLAQQYNYPIAPDETGRLVYNKENPTYQKSVPNALVNAYSAGNKVARAFGKMREDEVDDICRKMKWLTEKPFFVASMAECTHIPASATLAYGMTYNQTFIFDVVCPMLYSAEYEADASWVTANINYLKNLGYSKIMPSIQAYYPNGATRLMADIKAVLDAGCLGYLLFRTNTYDIARAQKKADGTLEVFYARGTMGDDRNVNIALNGVTPTTVTMGGKLSGTDYTIDGQTISFNAGKLAEMADYGTITIGYTGNNPLVKVTSNDQIVYNVPMD